MILHGFGLELESLREETAELLRTWRNNPRILQQMEYRDVISEAQQQDWFRKIHKDNTYEYFIIYSGLVPIGMIHLSHIDVLEKTAEAGLFIGDDRFSGTGVALGASILLLDYAFERLGLQEVRAKVKDGNTEAETYNSLLGFVMKEQLRTGFNWWKLSVDVYEKKKKLLQALIH